MPNTTGKFHSRAQPVKNKRCGDHTEEECNHQVNGKFLHYKPLRAAEGKEVVSTVEAGGRRRELIIPSRSPIDIPVVLPKSQFDRLKQQAHVITLENRIRMQEEVDLERNKLMKESCLRKEQLAKAYLNQKSVPGSKLDTVDSEAAKQNLYLLRRSRDLVTEQDERVKIANGIILATKCRAIRNAQIAEKELMKKELLEEEKRLDLMMEQKRQKMIALDEKKKEEENKKKQRHVHEIMQQIKENEIEKLLEAQRIEEESKMLNKALIVLHKEEEQQMNEKKIRQKHMREEFKKANDEAERYRNLQDEEQRIADLRVREFMRQKAEREEAREREAAQTRANKEKEISRLREQQEEAQDHQAALDELNALRTQEEKEKEWREKEKEAAKKRKALMEELKAARQKQIDDIRLNQAKYLLKDEEEFHKVAKVQRQLHEKEIEKREKKKLEIEKHRRELLHQINEKEKERIIFHQEKFEDGKAQRLEFEVKDRNVEDYLKQKVENLREKSVPEHYIKDIERQLKIPK